MARIRTIKPEFWVDEKIVECSAFARLLFIGLWNFADDEGRMEYREKKIRMQIFPADNLDISELIGELRRVSLIEIYVVDNKEYLQIRGFTKHQKVDKRSASKLPPPPDPAESPRIPPTEGIKEGIKEGSITPPRGSPPKLDEKRGSRLSQDWWPNETDRRYAIEKGLTDRDVDREAEKFRNYWLAKSGRGACKLDWGLTWRTWCLKAVEYAPPGPGGDDEQFRREQAEIYRGVM